MAVLALTAVTAAPAVASTRAERVAAADAFARRTLSLHRQIAAADARAVAAREARRAAAQPCAGVWQSAPAARLEGLRDIYFWYLSGGLWSVDARLYGSWIADLRRSKRIDRSPVLARAADGLRGDYAVVNHVYRAFPDACATVTAWRDAGWSDTANPITPVAAAAPRASERGKREASAQLYRYSKLWDHIGTFGIDEIDARVHATKGCDAIGKLLFPDDYEC